MRKKNKFIAMVMTLLLVIYPVLPIMPFLLSEVEASGCGTGDIWSQSNPLIICTAEQFNDIRNNSSGHYKLGANINLNVSPYNEGQGWVPIGDWSIDGSAAFSGSLDGAGYSINNLYINRPNSDYQGLFGSMNNANISNLEFGNVSIAGSYNLGALAGEASNSTFSNITMNTESSRIEITGDYQFGGLIGESVDSSYSSIVLDVKTNWSNFSSTNYGGLIGVVQGTNSLENVHILGDIVGHDSVGGLIGGDYRLPGNNSGTTNLKDSSFKGNINFVQSSAGGLIGYSHGQSNVEDSFVEADINGPGNSGGIIGSTNGGTITRTYYAGNVKGGSAVGGITGSSRATIRQSYSFGTIEGTSPVGGISGSIYNSSIENSYTLMNKMTTHEDLDFGSSDHGRIVGRASGDIYNLNNNSAWELMVHPYDNAFADRGGNQKDGDDVDKTAALVSLSDLPEGEIKERLTTLISNLVMEYTVSFELAGGSEIDPQIVVHGEFATEPSESPTKEGHTFVGWYTSSDSDTAYNFSIPITSNTTIYAKWEENINPFLYEINDDGEETVTITGYLGEDTHLVIPSEMDGKTVTRIRDGVNQDDGVFNLKSFSSIELPDTLLYIGDYAFSKNFHAQQGDLIELVIPNSVKTIGKNAFEFREITSLTLPVGLETIKEYAFRGNYLETVSISDTVTTLEQGVFSGNEITSFSLPNHITSIPDGLFSNNKLSDLNLSETVTSIGVGSFADNLLEGTFVIPNHVLEISEQSFRDNNIQALVINDSIITIPNQAFLRNPIEEIQFGFNVTMIGENAFNENNLQTITIPSSVTEIGPYAFGDSPSLMEVTIRNPNTTLGRMEFWGPTPVFGYYDDNWEIVSITIKGYAESTAEAYATVHGHNFESLMDEPTDPELIDAQKVELVKQWIEDLNLVWEGTTQATIDDAVASISDLVLPEGVTVEVESNIAGDVVITIESGSESEFIIILKPTKSRRTIYTVGTSLSNPANSLIIYRDSHTGQIRLYFSKE